MYEYLGSTDILMYDILTIYVSSMALLIYNLMHIREKKDLLSSISKIILSRDIECKKQKTHTRIICFTIMEIVLISLYQHGLVSVLNKITGNLLNTGVNYFGLIFGMPFLLPLLCWIIGVDPFRQIDLITPAYPVALFFMKMGCFCAGCCGGISCTWGMYNHAHDCMEFPVQLIEAGFAVIIFVVLMIRKKKAASGTLFSEYIILYCVSRFFSEFFRCEPSVFLGMKTYHILCVIGMFLGILQFLVIRKYRDSLERFFDNSLPNLILNRKYNKSKSLNS